jgi:RNA polymerase sigma-70 factor (ECF subfamily)
MKINYLQNERSFQFPHDAREIVEHELVERSKGGDRHAFVELVNRHSRKALGSIRRIVRNHEDVEDLFQETVMKAFTGIGSFNEQSSFSTWLTRIAINNSLMLLRKGRGRAEISLEAEDDSLFSMAEFIADSRPDPEATLQRNQEIESVRTAVMLLPKSLRKCAENRLLHDASDKDVATKLGITVSATKSRLARSRRMLRTSLKALQNRQGEPTSHSHEMIPESS